MMNCELQDANACQFLNALMYCRTADVAYSRYFKKRYAGVFGN